MIDFEIDIPTGDGAMNTFVAHPDGDGPFPAVFMYMPASGIRDELRDMARRLAMHGYIVLLPNLYYRMVRVLDVDSNRLFDEDFHAFATALHGCARGTTDDADLAVAAVLIPHRLGAQASRNNPGRTDRIVLLAHVDAGIPCDR